MCARKIGRADSEASERQPKPAVRSAEQLGHDLAALVVGQSREQLRRSIGHRSAEPVHLLEALRRVDRDGFVPRGRASGREDQLLGELLGFVGGRDPHLRNMRRRRCQSRAAG